MAKSYPTLEEVMTKMGFIPECREEECRLEEKEKIARNLLAEGMSIEKTASIAEMPVDKVRALAE